MSSVFLVTGNLDIWINPLAARLGCACMSSRASVSDGRIRIDHVLDKGDAVRVLRAPVSFDRIIAVGDGSNDVPMLRPPTSGIAFGGVHSPDAGSGCSAADYIVHSGDTLCSLLKAL